MFAFLASIGWKALASKAIGNAASDVAAVWKWLGTLNFYQIGCIALGILLAVQHIGRIGDHRHEAHLTKQLNAAIKANNDTQAAFTATVASYRAAAAKAKAEDDAKDDRTKAQQEQINEEQSSEYEARIAAARAVADRLRAQLEAATHPGSPAKPNVPGLPPSTSGPHQAPGQNGFSVDDRLTATEQAIQLDELIKWIQRQHAVDPNK